MRALGRHVLARRACVYKGMDGGRCVKQRMIVLENHRIEQDTYEIGIGSPASGI